MKAAAMPPHSDTVNQPEAPASASEAHGGGPGIQPLARYIPRERIDIDQCLDVLCQTPAGEKAVASLWMGLLEFGEAISEERMCAQDHAYTDLVIQAILFGDYENVANRIKEHARRRGHEPS